MAASKKRTFLEEYLQYGFTLKVEKDGTQCAQCLLCTTVLANASLKPSKLKTNLKNVHPDHAGDDLATFETKRARFTAAGTLPKLGYVPLRKPAIEASYRVAQRIAKLKKAHTITEELVKPCALEMTELMSLKPGRRWNHFKANLCYGRGEWGMAIW